MRYHNIRHALEIGHSGNSFLSDGNSLLIIAAM
jgi:hypothetical protein